ncbi:hypothetical protein FRC10_001856 [Ceratobasidium sp. 414]|nr:hypothetical protein FRC10_001856 [Ceratobasidium sp. 414]
MLSEKARGKQRATNDDDAPEQELPRSITVRFTEREPDLLLAVSSQETIRDIKALIRLLRPGLEKRRLRLVHAGRILTDGIRLVPWLDALETRARNAASAANRSAASSPTSPTFPTRTSISPSHHAGPISSADTWIHCSIGPEGEGAEDEEREQQGQIKPLTGFDRLASAGFSAEDIESMRRQFHSQRPEAADGDDEHARALEEQWVDNMDAGLPGTDPGDGGYLTLTPVVRAEPMYPPYLHGILMGFFFPLMPIFFLRELPPPAFFSDNVAQIEAPRSVVFS